MISVLLVCSVSCAYALNNGVGLTPAMGYNTWNDFRCDGITAQHVMQVADKMSALGLDKCWATSRGTDGRLVPDPKAFPNGMKVVGDYVHSKGFKFGIYTDRGQLTCDSRPASGGHEVIDAQTFADWGVDYVKEDHDAAFQQYGLMRDALNKTGREIYFSLCGWASWYAPEGWNLGNSWRIAGDCNEWPSVYNAIRTNEGLSMFARPGGWNDPDMLVGSSPQAAVHNTPDQARTQFSLWSVMAAPLLIGSNILNLSAYDLETYTNREVIAIDQDPLGIQGRVVYSTCPPVAPRAVSRVARLQDVPPCQQTWARLLTGGRVALNLVNFAPQSATFGCDAACFASLRLRLAAVRDVWRHADLGVVTAFTATVPGNGASVTVVLTPAS